MDVLLRHQTTLARFGELALRSEDLDEILTESCKLVGDALGTDLAKVLELQEDGHTLLVRAGIGWKPGVVGQTRVPADEDSSEGHALRTGEPVISVDLARETRFTTPDFLHDNGVQALVNVVIIGGNGQPPYGVLEVDSRAPRPFDENEIAFLQTYANLLAAAVHRVRVLREQRHADAFVRASSEVLYSLNADWTELRQLKGGGFLANADTAQPQLLAEYIPDDERPRVEAEIRRAIESKRLYHLEHRVRLPNGETAGPSPARCRCSTPTAPSPNGSAPPPTSPRGGRPRRRCGSRTDGCARRRRPATSAPSGSACRTACSIPRRSSAASMACRCATTSPPARSRPSPSPRTPTPSPPTPRATGDRRCTTPPTASAGATPGRCAGSRAGTGMAPDVVAKAFDPFFTTKPIGQGTGLGLSMIYGFARQSGGQVRIYSEVGQGTAVCLYLPRHLGDADTAELPPELAQAPRAEDGQTVLVVDDEPTVRMLVTEVLGDLGYRAVEAADGPAGLKVLQSPMRIDLLVTDVGLPGGMNGRQVADAARVARPGLKVLFITGYAENAMLSHGHLDPGMHVLTRPFAIEALASRIKELISS